MTTTRRRWHISALAAAALIVAACGGGDTDSPLASRVVVFGDSLSDIGTYTPATSLTATPGAAPYFGGKFTTNTYTDYALAPAGATRAPNTSNANTWVEWIAARVGVPITTAMSGFGPDTPQTRVRCPVTRSAPALAGSCTGYAQGGSPSHQPGRHQQPQRHRSRRFDADGDHAADGDAGGRPPGRFHQLQQRRSRIRLWRQQRRVHSVRRCRSGLAGGSSAGQHRCCGHRAGGAGQERNPGQGRQARGGDDAAGFSDHAVRLDADGRWTGAVVGPVGCVQRRSARRPRWQRREDHRRALAQRRRAGRAERVRPDQHHRAGL